MAIVLAGPWCTGCSWFSNLRGDNFTDRDANWGEDIRKPESEGSLLGFSEKARQIERNVGIR